MKTVLLYYNIRTLYHWKHNQFNFKKYVYTLYFTFLPLTKNTKTDVASAAVFDMLCKLD